MPAVSTNPRAERRRFIFNTVPEALSAVAVATLAGTSGFAAACLVAPAA